MAFERLRKMFGRRLEPTEAQEALIKALERKAEIYNGGMMLFDSSPRLTAEGKRCIYEIYETQYNTFKAQQQNLSPSDKAATASELKQVDIAYQSMINREVGRVISSVNDAAAIVNSAAKNSQLQEVSRAVDGIMSHSDLQGIRKAVAACNRFESNQQNLDTFMREGSRDQMIINSAVRVTNLDVIDPANLSKTQKREIIQAQQAYPSIDAAQGKATYNAIQAGLAQTFANAYKELKTTQNTERKLELIAVLETLANDKPPMSKFLKSAIDTAIDPDLPGKHEDAMRLAIAMKQEILAEQSQVKEVKINELPAMRSARTEAKSEVNVSQANEVKEAKINELPAMRSARTEAKSEVNVAQANEVKEAKINELLAMRSARTEAKSEVNVSQANEVKEAKISDLPVMRSTRNENKEASPHKQQSNASPRVYDSEVKQAEYKQFTNSPSSAAEKFREKYQEKMQGMQDKKAANKAERPEAGIAGITPRKW